MTGWEGEMTEVYVCPNILDGANASSYSWAARASALVEISPPAFGRQRSVECSPHRQIRLEVPLEGFSTIRR